MILNYVIQKPIHQNSVKPRNIQWNPVKPGKLGKWRVKSDTTMSHCPNNVPMKSKIGVKPSKTR